MSNVELRPHPSLTQRTAEAIRAEILSMAGGEDGFLPSVRLLSERYGVSTLVVREALANLQAQGILERRQGRRTRIVNPDHTTISSVLRFSAHVQDLPVDELQQCRAGLETKAAELAALSARPDKAAVLQPIITAMTAAKSQDAFNKKDLELHMAIAELSGNRPIQMILAALRDVIREALDVTYSHVVDRSGAGGIQEALLLHEGIADAIVGSDPSQATLAMTRHFRYFLEGSKSAEEPPVSAAR